MLICESKQFQNISDLKRGRSPMLSMENEDGLLSSEQHFFFCTGLQGRCIMRHSIENEKWKWNWNTTKLVVTTTVTANCKKFPGSNPRDFSVWSLLILPCLCVFSGCSCIQVWMQACVCDVGLWHTLASKNKSNQAWPLAASLIHYNCLIVWVWRHKQYSSDFIKLF